MSVAHLGYKSAACVAHAIRAALFRRPSRRAAPVRMELVQAKAYMYVYIEHMYTKWAEVLARCHL